MKKILLLLLCLYAYSSKAQEVTNLILVGPKGVTEDPKEATSFIIVFQYPDAHFERMDYAMHGPMKTMRSYRDTAFTILQGRYLQFHTNGFLDIYGEYDNNQKDGLWMTFDENGKNLTVEHYDHGVKLPEEDTAKSTKDTYGDEREATFPKGEKAWIKYLQKRLEESHVANQASKSGNVIINFRVDREGVTRDIYIRKSHEFVCDFEAIKIIRDSPRWIPAFRNGRPLNAYRSQPLTFVVD